MDDSEIEKFKARLLALKSELEGLDETSEQAAKPVELDQASVGRLSRMDAMQSQHMAKELARRRQLQRAKIEGALRRIESGEYGACSVCGEDIDVRRLALDPATSRCVKCADQ